MEVVCVLCRLAACSGSLECPSVWSVCSDRDGRPVAFHRQVPKGRAAGGCCSNLTKHTDPPQLFCALFFHMLKIIGRVQKQREDVLYHCFTLMLLSRSWCLLYILSAYVFCCKAQSCLSLRRAFIERKCDAQIKCIPAPLPSLQGDNSTSHEATAAISAHVWENV